MEYFWYRQTLSGVEREIYDLIRRGLIMGQASFRLPKCSPARLRAILELVRMDDSAIFYAEGFRYASVRGEENLTFLPGFTFQGKQRTDLEQVLEKRLNRILTPMRSLSEEEALLAVHRFILESVHYDKIKKQYSHEIIGPLQHGIGVCEGIARTVKLFCDRLDIPCVVVLGKGSPDESGQRHAWNMIRTSGRWRFYDFTYDLAASRSSWACMRYFAMDEQTCACSHGKSEYPIPDPEKD